MDRTDIGTLLIPDVKLSDSGTYMCVGSNSIGSNSAPVKVTVLKGETFVLGKLSLSDVCVCVCVWGGGVWGCLFLHEKNTSRVSTLCTGMTSIFSLFQSFPACQSHGIRVCLRICRSIKSALKRDVCLSDVSRLLNLFGTILTCLCLCSGSELLGRLHPAFQG